MDPASFNGLRPEWLEAVAAARWNLFLLPLFGLAPCLLDPLTGELVHDDLLVSAAMCYVLDGEGWGLGESEVIEGEDPLEGMGEVF